MPIVDIELVCRANAPAPDGLAQAIADDLGGAFEVGAAKIWVRIRTLSPENYAENQSNAQEPAFVTILTSAPPTGDILRQRIGQITAIVAQHTGRKPDLVHVLFEPAARGRIAFGGRLVE